MEWGSLKFISMDSRKWHTPVYINKRHCVTLHFFKFEVKVILGGDGVMDLSMQRCLSDTLYRLEKLEQWDT